jgi:hypothetical protein
VGLFKQILHNKTSITRPKNCLDTNRGTRENHNKTLMATVYEINKGINRSIEFKGIKAQYIIYLAVGMVGLLLLFAILATAGVSSNVAMFIALPLGAGLYFTVQRISHKHGEHGLMKKAAKRNLPACVQSRTRKIFIQLNQSSDEKGKKTGRDSAGI